MKISTRGRYALRAMIEVAKNSQNGKISLKEIAKSQEISVKYLAALLVKLQEGNLINSYRGKYGGYELAKKPEEITLANILEIVEGPFETVSCITDLEYCDKTNDCAARTIWSKISTDIKDVYSKYHLSELL